MLTRTHRFGHRATFSRHYLHRRSCTCEAPSLTLTQFYVSASPRLLRFALHYKLRLLTLYPLIALQAGRELDGVALTGERITAVLLRVNSRMDMDELMKIANEHAQGDVQRGSVQITEAQLAELASARSMDRAPSHTVRARRDVFFVLTYGFDRTLIRYFHSERSSASAMPYRPHRRRNPQSTPRSASLP